MGATSHHRPEDAARTERRSTVSAWPWRMPPPGRNGVRRSGRGAKLRPLPDLIQRFFQVL